MFLLVSARNTNDLIKLPRAGDFLQQNRNPNKSSIAHKFVVQFYSSFFSRLVHAVCHFGYNKVNNCYNRYREKSIPFRCETRQMKEIISHVSWKNSEFEMYCRLKRWKEILSKGKKVADQIIKWVKDVISSEHIKHS